MKLEKLIFGKDIYEVGKDDVIEIKVTNQGTDKLDMYRVLYQDNSYTYLGKLKENNNE